MKNFELQINVFGKEITAFLQPGFFEIPPKQSGLHCHHNAEMHCIAAGHAEIFIDGSVHTVNAGEVILIPKHKYHYYLSLTPDSRTLPFQLNMDTDTVRRFAVLPNMLIAFLQEIEFFKKSGVKKQLAAYISFLCSQLADEYDIKISAITNREFLIQEFFAVNYSEKVTLADLARTLNCSEKQAARAVQKYTGNSFKSELCKTRINIAEKLMEFEKISMAQACARVGYKSYSGFWKAYNSRKTDDE